MQNPSGRVVVIGAGNVGASIAYSVLHQEIASEVLIIDIAEEMAKAQVLDLQDAAHFTDGTQVKYATYSDIREGDIVVITCGAAMQEGQTRLDLLSINIRIIRDVVSKIKQQKKIVYCVMVTNPVDILTYVAIKEMEMPEGFVFGTGTYLDTARLKVEIAGDIKVNPDNINAYILGEHGDSSFPVLSSANIGGIPLENIVEVTDEYYEHITERIRRKAYNIKKGKKSTFYGIAAGATKICKTIIRNEERILPLSMLINGQYGLKDIVMGVPAKLSSSGAKIIGEIPLNKIEKELLQKSAKVIEDNIRLSNNYKI